VFLDYVLSRLLFGAEVIQTDDGAEFYRLLDGVFIDDSELFPQQTPRVGGLLQLQLPPTTRRTRWPDTL